MHPWMLVETALVTEFECYFACTGKGDILSWVWQNDICSFRVMNVVLTLSFKLISFLNIYYLIWPPVFHHSVCSVISTNKHTPAERDMISWVTVHTVTLDWSQDSYGEMVKHRRTVPWCERKVSYIPQWLATDICHQVICYHHCRHVKT